MVKDIIGNEAYIGHAVKLKTGYLTYKVRQVVNRPKDEWIRCENVFPPIISPETWDAVRLLDTVNHRPEGATTAVSLFHGLLRCADCGSSMTHKKSTSTSRVTGEKRIGHAYICSQRERSGHSVCTRHTIREEVLLAIIREDIQNRLESMAIDEGRIVREIRRRFNGDSLDDAKKQRNELSARLEELASLGRKLYEDRLKGIINIDSFKSLSEKAEEDKAAVRSAHDELSELIFSEERRAIESGSIIPKLREFLLLETLTYEMLADIIERIIVSESEGRSRHRTHDVRIIYRFEALI